MDRIREVMLLVGTVTAMGAYLAASLTGLYVGRADSKFLPGP